MGRNSEAALRVRIPQEGVEVAKQDTLLPARHHFMWFNEQEEHSLDVGLLIGGPTLLVREEVDEQGDSQVDCVPFGVLK